MNRHLILASVLLLGAAGCVSADPIIYNMTIDTSAISGTVGSLDFNFDPGPLITQSAYLRILSFASDGTLVGPTSLTGDVSGTLPATLTFDNGTGFNDYFERFTFKSTIFFRVGFFGPALSSPDETSTSGSTFAFSMFSNAAGTMPALTTDMVNGFAVTIDVNLDSSTTVRNFSDQTTVAPALSAVPEPSYTMPFVAIIGLGALCCRRFLRDGSIPQDARTEVRSTAV